MGEDIVELAMLRSKIAQIAHAELDVSERQIPGHRAGLGDRRRGQIDAREAALRQIVRQRIAAVATADFKHLTRGGRRGMHAEISGDRSQPIRMGLPSREGAIGDLIVGVIGHGLSS